MVEGDDVLFTCSFDLGTVVPLPSSVTWKFDSSTDNHSAFLNETGSRTDRFRKLELTSVNRTYAGTYQCVITNEFGTIYSSPAVLTVQCKSKYYAYLSQ